MLLLSDLGEAVTFRVGRYCISIGKAYASNACCGRWACIHAETDYDGMRYWDGIVNMPGYPLFFCVTECR